MPSDLQLPVALKDANGVTKGIIDTDALGRLIVRGPNLTSAAITIDELDRVQIGAPVDDPKVQLSVEKDTWVKGGIRSGRPESFPADAPFDPNGCIQLGRTFSPQAGSFIRLFYNDGINDALEVGRIGITMLGMLALMGGPSDNPILAIGPDGFVHLAGGGKLRIESDGLAFYSAVGTRTLMVPA